MDFNVIIAGGSFAGPAAVFVPCELFFSANGRAAEPGRQPTSE